MNRLFRFVAFSSVVFLAAAPGAALAQNHRPAGTPPQNQRGIPSRTLTRPLPRATSPAKEVVKTPGGEQFFIIASIDHANSQLLLKRPTEVTVLVKVDSKTKYLNEQGKSIPLAEFRAGDTVWARLSGDSAEPTATIVRKGEMTVADLHKYYLDYPEIK